MKATFGATKGIIPPLLLGVVTLLLWQLAVVTLEIKPFVLPSPTAIGGQFFENMPTVWSNSLVTGFNSLVGVVVGTVLGILLAVIASLVRTIDE
ncbi:MAG: ABC transporter permease, partial [Microbacteriaceae bacterium]|nr:ABC transporter permease [Microbacteriaceae bacterium]